MPMTGRLSVETLSFGLSARHSSLFLVWICFLFLSRKWLCITNLGLWRLWSFWLFCVVSFLSAFLFFCFRFCVPIFFIYLDLSFCIFPLWCFTNLRDETLSLFLPFQTVKFEMFCTNPTPPLPLFVCFWCAAKINQSVAWIIAAAALFTFFQRILTKISYLFFNLLLLFFLMMLSSVWCCLLSTQHLLCFAHSVRLYLGILYLFNFVWVLCCSLLFFFWMTRWWEYAVSSVFHVFQCECSTD